MDSKIYKLCSVKLWVFFLSQVMYHIIYFTKANDPDFVTYTDFQKWSLGLFFGANIVGKFAPNIYKLVKEKIKEIIIKLKKGEKVDMNEYY